MYDDDPVEGVEYAEGVDDDDVGDELEWY